MENPLRYKSFEDPTISSMHSKNAQQLVESMSFEDGDVIMDYGCGSGQFMAEYLFPRIPNPRCICGVDISPELIRYAYENCKNKENIYFAIGNIMDKYQWTFKENLVNKFVAYLVLCYVQDYRSFIKKVFDFLKPGGQVGMLVPVSKAYGIPYKLLSQPKWSQFAEKDQQLTRPSIAPWTYNEEVDAPTAIKDSLLSTGFRVDTFSVEERNLEFSSVRGLCEFLCNITSATTAIPEKYEEEFLQEMEGLLSSNLRHQGIQQRENNGISMEWKLLNFVATKA